MLEHRVVTTDAEIDRALETAKLRDSEPLAQTVEHVPDLNLLIVGLSNQRRLVLPIEDLQGLSNATHEQIKNYKLLGRGTGISFPNLDVDLYVPALIEGVYGNRRWMAQLGKKGGRARTEVKRKAAQANGVKGGRPTRSGQLRLPTADDFEKEIRSRWELSYEQGASHLDIEAGELHRKLGGYPAPAGAHRMPNCCQVMKRLRRPGDTIMQNPRKGAGASLVVRYMLPRSARTG